MNDVEMRAYLLGQAPEADAVRLEERLLEDEQIYTTLRSIEDDLFDEFARGTLTAVERERFIERYGADRERLLMAQALAERSDRPRHSVTNLTAVSPLRRQRARWRRAWIPLAAAAVLVAAVGASMWRRPRPTNAPPQARATVAEPVIAPAVLLVTLGSSRSAASVPAVDLGRASSALQLRVRLDPSDRFDRYVLELRGGSDAIVWRGEAPRTVSQESEPLVVGTVPGTSLDSGTYELAVHGVSAGGGSETLGFATVRVTRRP